MGRQRSRPSMKEKVNFPEELDEIEASILSDREFRVMIIRIINSMKKDIETIKKDQSEIKVAISEINNTLLGVINSNLEDSEDRMSVLENKVDKTTQEEQQKEKRILKK